MTSDRKELGRATDVFLGFEDHGIFAANVNFTFGASHQGTGMIAIGDEKGMLYLRRLLEAFGVSEWSRIPGCIVYVIREGGMIRGIEPLPFNQGRAFMFSEVWEA